MDSLIRPLAMVALVAACPICLSSCSRMFIVEPVGHYGQTITFAFYEPADKKPSKHNILDLTVQEKKEDDEWRVVWAIVGKQSLEEVEYGKQYEGLNELVPAKPLSLTGQYRVSVSERSLWGMGYASAEFDFDRSGALLLKRWTLPDVMKEPHTGVKDRVFPVVQKDQMESAKESLQAGHFQEAISHANNALAAGIYGVEPILIRAMAALQMGNYERAITDSSQYLDLGGKSIKVFQVRGSALGKLGRTIQAIDDFSSAIRHEPDNAIYWASRGSLRVTVRQAEQAIEDLETAAMLGRRTPGVYFDRGAAFRQLGRNEDAYDSYTQGLMLKPGYRNALLERGRILACLGRDLESVTDYSEIILQNPKDQEARLHRAWMYAELGELSASADDLHWVINNGEAEVAAYLELSNVLLRMGKISDAGKANESAMKLIKEGEVRYQILSGYQRGLLMLVQGQLEDAKLRYQTANTMAEEVLDIIAIEEAIRRLKGFERSLFGKEKDLGEQLLSSLEILRERIIGQSNSDVRYCVRGGSL